MKSVWFYVAVLLVCVSAGLGYQLWEQHKINAAKIELLNQNDPIVEPLASDEVVVEPYVNAESITVVINDMAQDAKVMTDKAEQELARVGATIEEIGMAVADSAPELKRITSQIVSITEVVGEKVPEIAEKMDVLGQQLKGELTTVMKALEKFAQEAGQTVQNGVSSVSSTLVTGDEPEPAVE